MNNVIELGKARKQEEKWAVLYQDNNGCYRSIYPCYDDALAFAKRMCLKYEVYIARIVEQVKLKEDYAESIKF